MNRFGRPKLRGQLRGQSLVEFALILPIFIFLAVVIFDFGRAVYYYNAIHNAAREGARYGVIKPNDDLGMIDAAEKYAVGLGLDNLQISASVAPSELVGNDEVGYSNTYAVTVTVDYCFVPVTPLVEKFIIEDCSCGCDHMRLTSEAVMRTEAKPSQ
jgi:Flp pilus assembly protein TadG